jgi:hypothetical protein
MGASKLGSVSVRFGAAPTGIFATVVPLIAVHTSRLIIPIRGHSNPLQGKVVGILIRLVVAEAHGRGSRAHCARIEADLETRVPARHHCTRRLHDDAEVPGIRSGQRDRIDRQRGRAEVLDGEGARHRYVVYRFRVVGHFAAQRSSSRGALPAMQAARWRAPLPGAKVESKASIRKAAIRAGTRLVYNVDQPVRGSAVVDVQCPSSNRPQ